eukprot:UN25788
MAEAKRTKEVVDWFSKNGLEPAGGSSAEENQQMVLEVDIMSDSLIHMGFLGANIFVVEGRNPDAPASLGTCVLLQHPITWGEEDKSPWRFVITAAHCVSKDNLGTPKKFKELRLRIPALPWEDFPDGKGERKYLDKAGLANEIDALYDTIEIQKEQVFIHPKYNGKWACGYDVAIIAIPEMIPSASASSHFFDTFKMTCFPESISVNGFPVVKKQKGAMENTYAVL